MELIVKYLSLLGVLYAAGAHEGIVNYSKYFPLPMVPIHIVYSSSSATALAVHIPTAAPP